MKRIFIVCITTSLLFGGYKEFNNNYSKRNLINSPLFSDMEESLGITEEEKLRMIEKYGDDENFKKGYYSITERQMDSILNKNLKIVDYDNALKYFRLSAIDDNLLASYGGLKVLKSNFLLKDNKIGQKYLRDMVYPLAKEEYINPMFWYGKSYLSGWSLGEDKVDYRKSIRVMDRVIKKLKVKEKKKKLKYLDQMTLDLAKRAKAIGKSMLYLKNEKRKKDKRKEKILSGVK